MLAPLAAQLDCLRRYQRTTRSKFFLAAFVGVAAFDFFLPKAPSQPSANLELEPTRINDMCVTF
jgi:hypothetical protein